MIFDAATASLHFLLHFDHNQPNRIIISLKINQELTNSISIIMPFFAFTMPFSLNSIILVCYGLLMLIILSDFTMSIEMARQSSIQVIIATVKEFKRTGERITELIRQGKDVEALTLLNQEEQNVSKIEQTLKQCQEGYLNPDVAKRLMIVRNQFKEEREKMAKLFHAVRVESQNKRQEGEQSEEEVMEGFDYELQSRLLRQKEQSLSQVHQKITNIHSIMQQTQQMTFKQGEQLNLIDDNLGNTKNNAVEANKHLEEANKLSASHNKCCIWLVIIVLIILCVILLVVLLECLIQVLLIMLKICCQEDRYKVVMPIDYYLSYFVVSIDN